MFTTSVLLILSLVATSYQDELEDCFKDMALFKTSEKHMERFAPLEEQCKKDGQKDFAKECAMKKVNNAYKECKSENKEATSTEAFVCACKKLNVEPPSKEELSFENYKKVKMEIVLESKAKYVEETIDSCKDDKDFHKCSFDKLGEKCEDVKFYNDMVNMHQEKE